jgi:hypothetical protein
MVKTLHANDPVSVLRNHLSSRPYTGICYHFETIGQLVATKPYVLKKMEIPNFGPTSLRELEKVLRDDFGLILGTSMEESMAMSSVTRRYLCTKIIPHEGADIDKELRIEVIINDGGLVSGAVVVVLKLSDVLKSGTAVKIEGRDLSAKLVFDAETGNGTLEY